MAIDTIYTIAGGAWFQDTLNGVASFLDSRAGDALIAMATAVSVIVGAATYIRTRNIMDLVKWAGFYVLVIAVLIGDKRSVQIIDLSEPARIYQVDNVPAGLAAPASMITRIGAGMAQTYDTIFARPDALTYSKTGMLFGAQLAAGSSDFRFSEPEIQRMFSDYVHNCVVGDIMLNNKYTIGELMNADDPYALIFSRPSPLRGLYDKNRNFLTCEQAATRINTDSGDISGANTSPFLQQILNTLHGFTDQVFGQTNGAQSALFTEMLGDSYNYFHRTSLTSTEIIRKNVIMNGLRSGLESFSALSGDTAGLVNVATQTSMAKMRLSQWSQQRGNSDTTVAGSDISNSSNLTNGIIYWFVRMISPFTEKMVSQPVYTIRYYEHKLQYSARQILNDDYTVYCGQLLKQELIIAGCAALLVAFVATFAVYWYIGRTGRQQSEDEIIGGRALSESPKDVARMMKKRGEASDIRIDDLPLKLDSEIQNMSMHGTVSTGKSTLMRKIMKQLRDRGDLVIIYDKGCTFIEDFYDESRDKVLNALDARCPNWDLWEECRTISELENASATLIPASSGEDPFWQGSARTIFAEGAERMRRDEDRSYNKFLRTLLAIQLDQLRTFLAGTPASTLVDGKIEKTAISIRSVLTNYVKAMRYLQGIDRPGREKFTIREWMKGQADKSKNGWLFITSDEQNHESLKPLISLWLSIAATSLLAMGPNRQRRVWFFYDELASLHKLPTLPRIISEARKFGGCFVLGFQSFAQLEEIYGPKAAAALFDLLNTKFFFRSPSAQIAKFVEEDIGETWRKKFSEQTSFGHEQVRDGISFGKEEERVSIVSYSDVQSLNDLQCFVTLPGSYPVVKLTMKYEAMPKVADSLLLRDVQTSLDQMLEDEITRRTEEERHKFAGLFEGASLIQAVPESNLSNTPPPSAGRVAAVLAETNTPPETRTLQTENAAGDADTKNTGSTAVAAEGGSTSTGGTERDIEQDLPKDVPPGLNSDGEVVDSEAYEDWVQASHQTRDMTRREEVNINHATDKARDFDDDREVF